MKGNIPDITPRNRKYHLAIGIWKKLPIPVTRMLGSTDHQEYPVKIQRTIPPTAAPISFMDFLHGFRGIMDRKFPASLENEIKEYFGTKHVFLVVFREGGTLPDPVRPEEVDREKESDPARLYLFFGSIVRPDGGVGDRVVRYTAGNARL